MAGKRGRAEDKQVVTAVVAKPSTVKAGKPANGKAASGKAATGKAAAGKAAAGKAATGKAAAGKAAAGKAATGKAVATGPAADPPALAERLSRAIPAPRTELAFNDAWQLLVATILSAQATDKVINEVTPVLFDRWPRPSHLADAPLEEIEAMIHRTGFFRRKAMLIQSAARVVRDQFGGEVPRTMADIVRIPGVARKTGNVVLGSALGVPSGIVVDTHVTRVAGRLGLASTEDAEKVEQILCGLWQQATWVDMGHRLLLHGRYVCTARKPDCAHCPVNELCPSREAEAEGGWEERAEVERRRIGRAAGTDGE